MPSRVLVVQHEDDCPPGLAADWLVAAGLDIEVRRPYAADPLPDSAEGLAGLLVLGGDMGANDDEVAPWLPAVRRLIADAVRRSVPFLGICLGHQLACVALGGEVAAHPIGPTVGLRPVGALPAAAGDPLLGGIRPGARALHGNHDVAIRLPAVATVLSATADGAPQAVRFAPMAWGVQFHPEATPAIVAGWVRKQREDAAGDEARSAEVAAGSAAEADVRAAADALSSTWLALGRALAAAAAEAGLRATGR